MKRTNLVLNEKLLQDLTALLGLKTYSEAVNRAMAETIRVAKIQKMANFLGKEDIWSGNLSKMREDHRPREIDQ